jgi:drug/metabolite transporter (DMT)-like permease
MKSNIILLIAAMIWGFAFVAQRSGMEHLGPFAFNAIRFSLGALSLIPLMIFNNKRTFDSKPFFPFLSDRNLRNGGIIIGLILFVGASFQQGGMVYTTAGSGGFITGLYIVLVPIFGLLFKQKTSLNVWIGATIALAGLYLLSVHDNFSIGTGDLLILVSTFFWSFHVLIVGKYSPRTDPIQLAFFQFIICAFLSSISALVTEQILLQNIFDAIFPLLYAGIVSAGIAFTLQIIAQQNAHPSHAAIIMSLESVFAVIGGWIILDEHIPFIGIIGCALMLTGMIISILRFSIILIKNKVKVG